jgi:3'-phosphoadenosine 5'-phosphosulfate sulfotransferase (PAPS reductase)/FAD synthetase
MKNKYIAFSGGVESTTMCILYGKGAKAIWCDTGAEHDVMYERIDKVEKYLLELHKGDFELIRLKPKAKHKGKWYEGLLNLAIAYKFLPSSGARYCTVKFKIDPIDKFLQSIENAELMIGFNVDEQHAREGNFEKIKSIKYLYPLIEDGYDREDCEEILRFHGMHPDFPIYMSRGGCKMCFFKTKKEYKAMYFLNPEEYWNVVEFEEQIQDERKNFFSIMGNKMSLRELAKECEQDSLLFGKEEIIMLYQREIKAKTCGAFCGR